MLMRTSIVTGLAAVLLSTAALADSTTSTTSATSTMKPKTTSAQKMADRCSSLETQFDQAIATHGTAPKVADAKKLRAKGGDLCNANKQSSGIKDLQQALKDLGVKPSA